MRDRNLNLTIAEIFKVPEFENIGHIDRYEKALVWNKCHPYDLIIMSDLNILSQVIYVSKLET